MSGVNLTIDGSLGTVAGSDDGLYVVNGQIEFNSGADCSDTDYVHGIFVAKF